MQHQLKDETKDSTSWWSGGEVEVDDVECRYVENGVPEYFSKADATKAATSSAASFAAGAAVAGVAALAALAM